MAKFAYDDAALRSQLFDELELLTTVKYASI
jgi:hypothetical protein